MIMIRLLSSQRAASAAEFALVLPLLILFLLGMVDTGRFMWEYNQAEKATQMGVRYAVATNLIPSGLSTYSFANAGGVTAGTPVPSSNAGSPPAWFGNATCNNTTCTCAGSNGICNAIGYNATAFTGVVDRIRAMYPIVTASNVQVEYRNIGLGYSGDPNGPDVAPLVTVRLIQGPNGFKFRPLTTIIFGVQVPMPDFRAALTLEDGAGTASN